MVQISVPSFCYKSNNKIISNYKRILHITIAIGIYYIYYVPATLLRIFNLQAVATGLILLASFYR